MVMMPSFKFRRATIAMLTFWLVCVCIFLLTIDYKRISAKPDTRSRASVAKDRDKNENFGNDVDVFEPGGLAIPTRKDRSKNDNFGNDVDVEIVFEPGGLAIPPQAQIGESVVQQIQSINTETFGGHNADLRAHKGAAAINAPGSLIALRRQAAADRYFKRRETRVNPIDHEFTITGRTICEKESPYLLIVIPSMPNHFRVREVIRQTYGSYARVAALASTLDVTVKLLFLVGRGGNKTTDNLIKQESRSTGDIVQADFKEAYSNLTRKMLLALKWTSVYCSDIDFLLKVDEDVFVNVPILLDHLRINITYGINGAMAGWVNPQSSVRRKGKWAVSWREYPLLVYPPYMSGNSYVISGNIIPRMFGASEYIPYMPIEDVFVTGILGRVVGAELITNGRFTRWKDPVPNPCIFIADRQITATKVTTFKMHMMWKVSQDFNRHCHM